MHSSFYVCQVSRGIEGLNYALQNANWEVCFEQPDVDFVCSKWNETFLNLAREYIPNKVIKIRTDEKPWYNSELRRLSSKKKNLHRKAKRTNSPADWNNFRMIRNLYTGKIREAISKIQSRSCIKA